MVETSLTTIKGATVEKLLELGQLPRTASRPEAGLLPEPAFPPSA